MENSQGSEEQPQDAQQRRETTATIQEQQSTSATGGGNNDNQPPERPIETLWNDFWRIPLKDRLMIWLTILLLVVGAVTAFVFVKQLRIMDETLTEIKTGGDQTERLVITGLGQMAVANRVAGFAQQQATAAQDNVAAIQKQTTLARQSAQEDRRPWVGAKDFECIECSSTPLETNPNDARTPVTVEKITTHGMYVILENSGRTPALDMNYSSFFGITRIKSDPVPDYDSYLAEVTPKAIPDEYTKQVEIVKKFTGFISTVLPPNSTRKLKMPEEMVQQRRLDVPIPQQEVTYAVGKVTYYGPERKTRFVTTFCLMNEKGVEFRFCPSGNDMK